MEADLEYVYEGPEFVFEFLFISYFKQQSLLSILSSGFCIFSLFHTQNFVIIPIF